MQRNFTTLGPKWIYIQENETREEAEHRWKESNFRSVVFRYLDKEFKGKRCAGCVKGVKLIGPNFRPPPQKDVKAWKKVEQMIEDGNHYFTPCRGRSGMGFPPYRRPYLGEVVGKSVC
ncbi:hypothetical protein HDV00_003992 [Rhizophlyctis rosea]|nr:hypothetical protein HDV00_003992 [Rhizophlyctis rosea]